MTNQFPEYVWVAWWYNGEMYEDSQVDMVGVYSTPELALEQGKKYNKKHAYRKSTKVTIEKVKVDRKVIK
jgi:hypothetical protein